MSCAVAAPAFSLFPVSTASPNAFAIFAAPQSPRDTFATQEEMWQMLRPSNGQADGRKRNASFSKSLGLKKFFGMVIGGGEEDDEGLQGEREGVEKGKKVGQSRRGSRKKKQKTTSSEILLSGVV
ncbi:uncharacterized protein FIBRA_01470 [Fibroporia radiculosa]|uniref:Uncharacterized protein n=1 Tax=Fibroporia radiculosa TaxID=599839 RepID=J4HTE3_9APHY|nr:uncharacterized protein FIBRA_01470 [Fibroporia radiculosa]CCL99452.1 predicted protein [Fibroporia radiculosa]